MDLGIAGRTALVCAASKGLGRACAIALAREGVNVTIVARTPETLEQTANEIRKLAKVEVTAVAADITTQEGTIVADHAPRKRIVIPEHCLRMPYSQKRIHKLFDGCCVHFF